MNAAYSDSLTSYDVMKGWMSFKLLASVKATLKCIFLFSFLLNKGPHLRQKCPKTLEKCKKSWAQKYISLFLESTTGLNSAKNVCESQNTDDMRQGTWWQGFCDSLVKSLAKCKRRSVYARPPPYLNPIIRFSFRKLG